MCASAVRMMLYIFENCECALLRGDTVKWKVGLRVVNSCSVIYSMRKYDMLKIDTFLMMEIQPGPNARDIRSAITIGNPDDYV